MVPLLPGASLLYFLPLTMLLAWAEFFKPLIPEKEKNLFLEIDSGWNWIYHVSEDPLVFTSQSAGITGVCPNTVLD